jgi:uncharacterized protein (DUF58 family)
MLFQGGKLAWMLFVVMLILSIYLALGRWSGIAKAKGRRTLPGVESERLVAADTTVVVEIDTEIPGFWPIPYVFVQDRLRRKGGGELVFHSSFVPDWRRRGHLEYSTPPMRRGYYSFGQTECSTEDIFGLFEHSGELDLNGSFGVLPRTVAIKEWRQFHQVMKGLHHHSASDRAMRETTQINGVREYHYGDRLSRIHWNATAKSGEFKSKEFERESLPKTVLVLDRHRGSYASEEQFELAVSIAASLLDFCGRHDMELGLLSVGGDSVYFEPKRNSAHRREMLRHLIEVEPNGQHPLQQVLQNHRRSFASGSFFAVISPVFKDPMMYTIQWLDTNRINFCHFWLPEGVLPKASEDNWLTQLRKKDCFGYAIHTLDELPHALGGWS